jgi:hypothetical protein
MHGNSRRQMFHVCAALLSGIALAGAAAAVESPETAVKAGAPFAGGPFTIPGRFEAEDFNRGGQDVAYHDNAPGNTGGAYRAEEDVDIRATGDADTPYVVFNFETGEWLSYTVDVARDGQYDVVLRVGTTLDDAAFRIEIDGVDVSGRVTIPSTGSWQSYRWVGAPNVQLTAGPHVLRVVSAQQYFNFDAVRVTDEESELSTSNAEPPRDADADAASSARAGGRLARAGR